LEATTALIAAYGSNEPRAAGLMIAQAVGRVASILNVCQQIIHPEARSDRMV
jgi:hypothetical protein